MSITVLKLLIKLKQLEKRIHELEAQNTDITQFCAKKLKMDSSKLWEEFEDFIKNEEME